MNIRGIVERVTTKFTTRENEKLNFEGKGIVMKVTNVAFYLSYVLYELFLKECGSKASLHKKGIVKRVTLDP